MFLWDVYNVTRDCVNELYREYDMEDVNFLIECLMEVADSGKFTKDELAQIGLVMSASNGVNVGGGFDQKTGDLWLYNFEVVDNYDDFRWLIWHEMGHARDYFDNRIRVVANDDEHKVYFDGVESADMVLHTILSIVDSDNAYNVYSRYPHEASANAFAYIATQGIDLDLSETYQIAREVGKECSG